MNNFKDAANKVVMQINQKEDYEKFEMLKFIVECARKNNLLEEIIIYNKLDVPNIGTVYGCFVYDQINKVQELIFGFNKEDIFIKDNKYINKKQLIEFITIK